MYDYALLVSVKVIPLDLFKNKEHIHNRWAFGGTRVGIWWYSGGHLMVLRWGTHSQQVGIWWYSGGHLVVFRWGKHGAYFRKWATPLGPHQNTMLAPATANEQKPARPQLGLPTWAQCGSPAWAHLVPMWSVNWGVALLSNGAERIYIALVKADFFAILKCLFRSCMGQNGL